MKEEIGKGDSEKNCDIILRFLKVSSRQLSYPSYD